MRGTVEVIAYLAPCAPPVIVTALVGQIVAAPAELISPEDIINPEDIIAPTNIPSTFNVNQIKYILLGLTPISVFAFMIVHTARRVFTSPIENENVRVVKKSFKAPTFKERFRETFLENT